MTEKSRAVIVEGPLVQPGVVNKNGVMYTKEAIQQMIEAAKEKMKAEGISVSRKFSSKPEDVEGRVVDMTVEVDGTPRAKVELVDSEPGRVVADIINEGRKELRLAWCVVANDEDRVEDENGVLTVHKMDIQSLTFTDDHASDVDPVKKVE